MHPKVPRAHDLDLFGRVEILVERFDGRADQVARVEARADERVVVFDRGENDLGRIPSVQVLPLRPVRMNADGDLVLLAQFVEAVEAVRGRVGTDRGYA